MKALGHIVLEKKICLCVSNCKSKEAIDLPPGGTISNPSQGHAWQDLCKSPHNNAAYQIK